MTKITTDMLCRCTGQAKRRKEESQEQFLKRVTHLFCAEKGIQAIDNLDHCRSLRVLYLYDNLISRIEHLDSLASITHLYLQNNHITRMENLSSLNKLTKLYLSGNAITVVEGLDSARNLKELHIAHQRMPEGEKLLFEPRSLQAIAMSLEVLNVSENGLDSIEELGCLTELNHFAATNNQLCHIKDLSKSLNRWSKLFKLDLLGNPICQHHKYRGKMITVCPYVSVLDGKEVTDMERQFLMNWKSMRTAQRHQRLAGLGLGHQQQQHKTTLPPIPPTMPPLPSRQPLRRKHLRGLSNPSAATVELPPLQQYTATTVT